ncbi:MAG: DNA polymerase [Flavobacterium sp.]|nr:DNA polymerase [Flavobacterium sp.]
MTLEKQKVNLREAFVAPKGYLFASCDFSSQELRGVAALCGDPNLAAAYKLEKQYQLKEIPKPLDPNGNPYKDPRCDLHILAAANISNEVKRLLNDEPWNCNPDLSSVVKKYRKLGKIYNFGLIYLATAQTLAEQTGTTVEEAQQNLENYFAYPNGFWKLGNWLKTQAAIAAERRWIRTAVGDMLFVHESNAKGADASNAAQRKGVNGAVQGMSSTQTKISLIKCQKKFDILNFKYRGAVLNGREGRIIAPIHDESDCIIPGDCNIEKVIDDDGYIYYKSIFDENNSEHTLALEYGEALKSSMIEAQQYTFDRFLKTEIPAGADISIHKYWKH